MDRLRRAGRLFESVCECDNWKLAWLKAIRGKSRDPFVLEFRKDLDENLEGLRHAFHELRFPFGQYEYFTIRDPKERTICAASFPERIAHHAIMNVLDPVFESYQIFDSYACRRGKGTQAAVLRAFHLAKANRFFLKMDVRKYFDSIDHEVLKSALRRRIKDDRLLAVLDSIVDSYATGPGKGIPIGNLTSQYFANHYLGALDHRAKDAWRVRNWIRYMDDVIVAADRRNELVGIYRASIDFCRDTLSLHLKPAVIDAMAKGAPFLGFLIKPSGIFLSSKSRLRFERRYRSLEREFDWKRIGEAEFGLRAMAMCAHIDLARAHRFRYDLFHGRVLGRQSRESRRELEQRCGERAFGQSEQQQPREPEQ